MPAAICVEPAATSSCRTKFEIRDYDLDATLESGQVFRWRREGDSWIAVLMGRWVRLTATASCVHAETAVAQTDWRWLETFLQPTVDIGAVVQTFPTDDGLHRAVAGCRGLRLLRQEPWECLASFILSSSKRIVQIRQIIALLCERFGEPVEQLPGHEPALAFPPPYRIAALTEQNLRGCRMGFRAPFLLEAARRVADGKLDLDSLRALPLAEARATLMEFPGVGRKIADCVLLFALGFNAAFPVDVWVMKALRELYFPGRAVSMREMLQFSEAHFGRHAGYAQQYLFHYTRTRQRSNEVSIT